MTLLFFPLKIKLLFIPLKKILFFTLGYLFFFYKKILLLLKILIFFIGMGGWISLIGSYFNFFYLMAWPLSLFLQFLTKNHIFSGVFGTLVINNQLLLSLYGIIVLLFIYEIILKLIKNNYLFSLMEPNYSKVSLQKIFNNLKISIINIKKNKNFYFYNNIINIHHSNYPLEYIIYDLKIFFNNPIKVLIEKQNKKSKITFVIFNYNNYNNKYLTTRKILYSLFNWKYGFQWILSKKNYWYLGLNNFNQLMIFPLKKFYNVIIIDKNQTLSVEYNNNYLFNDIINNSNNIVYIINQIPNENISNHYKYILKQLEDCFVQSKINKKPVVIFFYHQFNVFLNKINDKLLNYLKAMISNSIGYFNIFIIENNSQWLISWFYQNKEKFINHNTCLLLNGVDNMYHSKILTGVCDFENINKNYWLFQDYNSQYFVQLPQN